VVVSYAVAGLSALLSSLCYAEFAVNLPMCGGAYSYISAVFGEYLAWITVTNLILEYMLANAAVIRWGSSRAVRSAEQHASGGVCSTHQCLCTGGMNAGEHA